MAPAKSAERADLSAGDTRKPYGLGMGENDGSALGRAADLNPPGQTTSLKYKDQNAAGFMKTDDAQPLPASPGVGVRVRVGRSSFDLEAVEQWSTVDCIRDDIALRFF
jgi:hypothetical protein